RIRSINSNYHYVGACHVVLVCNEATLFQRNVYDVRVVRRDALSVTPPIILSLVSYVVVERPAAVTNIRSHDGQIFNGRSLSLDRFSVFNNEWFSQTLRAIRVGSWPSREVKSVNVTCAVLLNNRDDALTHTGQ